MEGKQPEGKGECVSELQPGTCGYPQRAGGRQGPDTLLWLSSQGATSACLSFSGPQGGSLVEHMVIDVEVLRGP